MKKNWFVRIGFLIVALAISLAGIIAFVTYEPRTSIAKATKTVQVDGQDVKVEVYGRNTGDQTDHPVFAVCELVNKSINYKLAHPEEDVYIDYAIYRMETDTACYYNPKSRKYGKTTIMSKPYKKDCETVAYSFVKAAKNGIRVRLIYHRDKDLNASTTYDWFQTFMNEKCFFDETKRVADFLNVRKAQWNLSESMSNQMHNKQLLVSDYVDWDGTEYHNAVNSMTSNVDSYLPSNRPIKKKDWTHSGFTISGHDKVFEANQRYFDITFANWKNRFAFVEDVLNAHKTNSLNYADDYFECYFTPIPQNYMDGYDVDNNPFAKYIEKLNDSQGQIKCYMNMYSLSAHALTNKMCRRLNDAFKNNQTKGNDCGFIIKKDIVPADAEYQNLKEIGYLSVGAKTHSKDIMFYYGDTDEYVVITGSTNLGYSGWFSKSNHSIVFKEKGESHEIYDAFYKTYLGADVK